MFRVCGNVIACVFSSIHFWYYLRVSFSPCVITHTHEYIEQARDAARIDVYNQNRAARYGNNGYGNSSNSYGNSSHSNSGTNLGSLAISVGGASTNAHSGTQLVH